MVRDNQTFVLHLKSRDEIHKHKTLQIIVSPIGNTLKRETAELII